MKLVVVLISFYFDLAVLPVSFGKPLLRLSMNQSVSVIKYERWSNNSNSTHDPTPSREKVRLEASFNPDVSCFSGSGYIGGNVNINDIMCRYGTYVSGVELYIGTFVDYIQLLCSDGASAGGFGQIKSTSTLYAITSAGVTYLNGGSGAWLDWIAVQDGTGYGNLQQTNYWSCRCPSNTVMRGLRYVSYTSYQYTLFFPSVAGMYCDVPCPSGEM